MIKFRKKNFSVLGDTIQGANIGAGVGTFIAAGAPKKLKPNSGIGKFFRIKKETSDNYNKLSKSGRSIAVVATATIVGAALGALVGTVKEIDKKNSRKSIVNDRLMSKVVDNLKKQSFVEGRDFTRDPKIANELRTRVCIVITRVSGDLRLLINTVSDPKLKRVTDETVNTIQNSSVVNNTASNNYNEISISTISDGSADSGLISGICERFIRSGYPVYLVEVG